MSVAEPETVPAVPAAAAAAGLRLLPAPVSAPPYDDELPAAARLRLVPPADGSAPLLRIAGTEPHLRLVPAPVPAPVPGAPADDDEPGRPPLSALPPVRPFAHALVQRLLEVQAGLRPLGQLQRDTTLELFDELAGRLGAGRPASGPRPTRRDVRSLHVQERADGVAEVCATVRQGGDAAAPALRLEGRSDGWRCTALAGV